MQEKLSWHNEKRKVNDLIPNPENPRRMSEKQSEELRKSLERFNLAEISAVNTDNRIVAGHMRVATLQLLGRGNEEILHDIFFTDQGKDEISAKLRTGK